jgi:hypothetical protein
MARQPLPRYRADVLVTVELGARDEADANSRVFELVDAVIRPRLKAAIGNAGGRTATLVAAYPSEAGASAV